MWGRVKRSIRQNWAWQWTLNNSKASQKLIMNLNMLQLIRLPLIWPRTAEGILSSNILLEAHLGRPWCLTNLRNPNYWSLPTRKTLSQLINRNTIPSRTQRSATSINPWCPMAEAPALQRAAWFQSSQILSTRNYSTRPGRSYWTPRMWQSLLASGCVSMLTPTWSASCSNWQYSQLSSGLRISKHSTSSIFIRTTMKAGRATLVMTRLYH